MTYRFTIEDVLDFLTAPDGDWDDELDAWVNVKVDGATAVMTFNPTLGDDVTEPDSDSRERFRVTVERIRDAVCGNCDGCGQVADTDDREPWTAWESLPPGSDMAVRMGLVKPVPCPDCQLARTDTTKE